MNEKPDSSNDQPISARKLAYQIAEFAAEDAERIDVKPHGQFATSVGTAVAAGSLTYFLGADAQYFLDGLNGTEAPLYVGYIALSLLSVQSLLSICGKKSTKTTLAGVLTGGTGGLGVAAVITGMAFGLLVDIVTLGGFTIFGGLIGFILTRRGKKRHAQPCGMKLLCDTWICPKCKRLINPTTLWSQKDQWDILDICQYLDVGGLKMNTVQALAFLDFTKLLKAGHPRPGFPTVWTPQEIKDAAIDTDALDRFAQIWLDFTNKHDVFDPAVDIEKLLLQWENFRRKHTATKAL